ncbi:MAG: energy transducer TonB [Blastocatellia bacterium]|nr:energy transducer TonB [Blastocatellia bacterium]
MKKRTRMLLSSACMAAMMSNGLIGAMAQDRQQEKKQEVQTREMKTFTLQSDGKTATVTGGAIFSGPEGTFNIQTSAPGMAWAGANGQQGGDFSFFFSQDMSFDARVVKGAPISAATVSETIQTLPDGNRIVQRSEGHIYRDSQGRTRNERTFRQGGSAQEKQTITIYDPNSGDHYILDPEKREARKMTVFIRTTAPSGAAGTGASAGAVTLDKPVKINVSGGVLQGAGIKRVQPTYPDVAKAARAEGAVQVQVNVSETGQVTEATAVSGHPLLRDAAVEAARQWEFKPTELQGKAVKVQGILTFNFTLAKKAQDMELEMQTESAPATFPRQVAGRPLLSKVVEGQPLFKVATSTENLGKQTIEGVECEGKRTTTTLPAGSIGNENPIQTVRETWYSPELQMTIMTKQTDPRFGESTYRVTNINRTEPDATFFTLPSDYTIKASGPATGTFRFEGKGPGGGEGVQFFRREKQN